MTLNEDGCEVSSFSFPNFVETWLSFFAELLLISRLLALVSGKG